jgi:hypothetical protein
VRGRPFASITAAWSQKTVSRIADIAHHRTATGHYPGARTAITKGIEVEPTAELLYRHWITLEAAPAATTSRSSASSHATTKNPAPWTSKWNAPPRLSSSGSATERQVGPGREHKNGQRLQAPRCAGSLLAVRPGTVDVGIHV